MKPSQKYEQMSYAHTNVLENSILVECRIKFYESISHLKKKDNRGQGSMWSAGYVCMCWGTQVQ